MKSIITFLFLSVLYLMPVSSPAQSSLCEQFENTTFPPPGWTLQFTGTLYWSRANLSGFNNGTGSAKFDMWNAAAGVNQSLISPIFLSTSQGDSLVMDLKYNYFGAPDSLIILASTDGGTNYFSVHRLGPLQLTTCHLLGDTCFSQQIWEKRKYLLPTSTNRIQFLGKSGFGDNLYLDSICIQANPLGINNNGNVAGQYNLEQNYPNPFNPSTNIKFSIPKSSFVKLTVTDGLGREIKTLINEFRSAGSYNVDFDASELASGVYFYSIETSAFAQTKKMLLIK